MHFKKPSHKSNIFSRIESLKPKFSEFGSVKQEDLITVEGKSLPIYSMKIGNDGKDVPTILFVGGVHGIEKIGAEVVVAYMETLCELLKWDSLFHSLLKNIRILFYPIVNPGGIVLQTRANPNGVDLMRNAPVEAPEISKFFLPGGQRISKKIPWYRGRKEDEMELENRCLLNFLKTEVWHSPFSLIVDFHSGFGMKDRIWFPYAYTKLPFPRTAEMFQLKSLFDRAYPYNIHEFEPQALHYRTHGDFWDYVSLEHEREKPSNIMLPLCLELGSWIWVKKNPRQFFSYFGLFNPMVPHRQERTLRRHIYLLDFFLRATNSYKEWSVFDEEERLKLELKAHGTWR